MSQQSPNRARAIRLLDVPPIKWERKVDAMTMGERGDMYSELAAIAFNAARMAGYIDVRHGYGCGDQGHKTAVRKANRWGSAVWCKVFGYGSCPDMTI